MSTHGPEIHGPMTQGDDPDWRPLVRAVGEDLAGDFMWMYEVVTSDASIHAYKHIDTRRYVHLDAELSAYAWVREERYRRVPIWRVLEEALRDAERFRPSGDISARGL